MRPRELIVSGFRSYATETRLCWEGRGLVGIVGPIGSGKSSILDAISFALYGKTPRIERDTKSLINQRRDVAQVSLTFDVDGSTFKAVRSLRRNGASAHAFYRVDDGVDVEVADRAQEMGQVIETLLGLDFDAFTRSVLLAQNRFAGFLEATATERNQVLKGVFGFDRLDAMRAVAKGRLDGLGNTLAVLADRRASAKSDAADLEVKRAELKVAEERAEALDRLRKPFEETKELIAAAGRRMSAALETLVRLDTLASRIPDRAATDKLLTEAASIGSSVAVATEALAGASAARQEAASRVEEALRGIGGREGLEAAGDRVAAWRNAVDRLAEVDRALGETRQRLESETARRQELAGQVVAAEQTAAAAAQSEATAIALADAADVAVRAAHQEHRAHAVRADLVVGAPCPVCEQTVLALPAGAVPASIEAAEQASARSRQDRADASVAARDASERLARIRAAAEGADEAIVTASAAVVTTQDKRDQQAAAVDLAGSEVAGILGKGDPAELLDGARSGVARAQRAAEEALVTENQHREALEVARSTARESQAALASLRTELATLAGLLEADVVIGDEHSALQEALGILRAGWVERRAAADAAVTAARDESQAARKAQEDLFEAAGLGAGDDMADIMAAALSERSAKEAEVNLLEKRLGDLQSLADDEAELIAASDLLRTIHADLAPSKFLEFVLDERRRVLGDLASEHFEMLSAGRYRFDDTGEFQVVDLTAADAIRAPSSLSGGETFLASLALALALAEIVAREGGRLDAFFLDEGFGSLDPEHLDLAMSGIERLVTTGADRLVVVVSHVPAMTERIEDLLVLDRHPVTGDTLVVSGDGCR